MTKYERDAAVAAEAELQIVMNLFTMIRPKVGKHISEEGRRCATEITDLLHTYQNEVRKLVR